MKKKNLVQFIHDTEAVSFSASRARNKLSQQRKYEAVIANQCSCLGVRKIIVTKANAGNTYYKPEFSGA